MCVCVCLCVRARTNLFFRLHKHADIVISEIVEDRVEISRSTQLLVVLHKIRVLLPLVLSQVRRKRLCACPSVQQQTADM